jgi:spermidine synthase
MNDKHASLMSEFSQPKLLQQYQADDNTISVFENASYRWIQTTDNSIQSAMNRAKPGAPVLPYFPALLSALLFSPDPQHTLVIGLGGGELIRFFNHYYPATRLLAAEKSEPMSAIFRDWFQQETTDYELIVGDICDYCINDGSDTYDLVFLDVYAENALPACFNNREFFEYISRLLATDGILAINLVVNNEREAVEILQLIRQAFDRKTLCLSVGKHMNIVVLAFRQTPQMFSVAQLQKIAVELDNALEIDYQELVSNILASNPNDRIDLSFY